MAIFPDFIADDFYPIFTSLSLTIFTISGNKGVYSMHTHYIKYIFTVH